MSSAHLWMFCPKSGYLLDLKPAQGVAECALSGYQRSMHELEDTVVVSETDMEDYQRRYQLEPLVRQGAMSGEEQRVRATVDELCPKCGAQGLEFYTLQLRSADEGQTVFYECKKCKHKFSQNT